MTKTIAISFFLALSFSVFSQTKDSVEHKEHSPHRAAVLSAVLPGAGQVYNKKLWKVPIVYLGLGVAGYFTVDNNTIFRGLKNEYLARLDGKPYTIGEVCDLRHPESCSNEIILENIDVYRKYRDISVLSLLGVYALQIVDAAVDAHLFNFDVSDDLSLHWQPNTFYSFTNNAPTFGASIILKLR